MNVLRPIESLADFSSEVCGTPNEDLRRYPNMGATHSPYSQEEALVGMCMDHRGRLSFPEKFACIIRSAWCNLRYSDFQISYAVAIGGVSAIALVSYELRHNESDASAGAVHIRTGSARWVATRMGEGSFHETCGHV